MKQNKLANYIFRLAPVIFGAIVFGAASYNFVSLWLESNVFSGCAGIVCPWYYEWSYFNEPTILLVASFFLLFNRRSKYFISGILSGFVIIKTAYLISQFGLVQWIESIARRCLFFQEYEFNILQEPEVQPVLAIIIFGFGISSFIFTKTRKTGLN